MTNQIYLVLYEGDYSDDNIIAIVDTKAKFSEEDIRNINLSSSLAFTPLDVNEENLLYTAEKNDSLFTQKQKNPLYSKKHMEFICNNFDYGKNTTLSYKNKPVNVSAFIYRSVYKLGDNIYNLTSDILIANCIGTTNFGYLADIYYINPTVSCTENSIWQFDEKQLKDCWNDITSKDGDYDNNFPINPNFTDLSETELSDTGLDKVYISNNVYISNPSNSDITEVKPYSKTDSSLLNSAYFIPGNASVFKIHSNSMFSSNSIETGGFVVIGQSVGQQDANGYSITIKNEIPDRLYCVNFDKNNPSAASFKLIDRSSPQKALTTEPAQK